MATILIAQDTVRAAEIYIDRRGQIQIDINNLTNGASNNSRNDGQVADFNYYIARTDAQNPIEWMHQWDLATPSDGNIPIDADEVYTTTLAAEIFAVVWDVDYPSSNEYDILFWDTTAYAGGAGAGFTTAANPAAVNLGRVQGNNNIWGAKRISLDPAGLGPGQTEYFWLQVDEDPGGTAWKSSIDYSDLAIVFNEGKLSISKSLTHDSGFDPPRVGHTSYYLVRVDISNPTLTSTGGPVYDVKVTDKFAAGSTIVTNPNLGTASMDAAGNLSWNVGILQDGALNTPPAAGSTAFMVVRAPVTPVMADLGNPITLNTGATITGGQVPEDPGDGTGTLYPFNFFSAVSNQTNAVSVVLVTPTTVDPANPGSITSTASIEPADPVTVTVTDADLNVNAAAADNVTVSVRNQRTNELENVVLTETGPNTGVFSAVLATVPGAAAGADNSGAMNVQNADVLRATYNETADANGLPQVRTSDTTVVDNSNSITITSPIGTFNTATHNVTGTTNPYSTVTMIHPVSGAILSTTATASGTYTFSNVTFPEGSTTYTANSTDPSGNTASAVATVKIDTTNSVTIASPANGSTINTTTSDISGVTNADSTVTLIEPGTGNTLTTTADSSGNYTFVGVSLNVGANTLNVSSTDPVGNVAATTGTLNVDPDISLNITSITHGATYTTTLHEVAGKTDPNATLTYTHPTTGAALTTTADASGNYSFGSFTFPAGLNTATVNATDTAGNSATASVTFTIDTSNTNTVTTSGTFTVSAIDIQGTTDPLSTVKFTHPLTGATYTALANAAGAYVFEDMYFPDGTYAISTTSTDPQGNVAAAASTLTVVTTNTIILNMPPNNSVVNTSPLQVCGTTAPGSSVSMVDPVTGATYVQTADASGSFCFPSVNLAAGANTFTMVSTDPSGVAVSHTHNLFYDPNITLNIKTPEHNSVHQGTVHDVTGATVAGATVTMAHPISGATLTTTADAGGNYTFAAVTFPRGTNVVTVNADDGLGHTATTSNTFVITSLGQDAGLQTSERTVFGNPVFLEVVDPETYRDATKIDTIQVLVTNQRTGEFEMRTLVETGINTGIYRGLLNTVESGAADTSNNGTMAVLYGDTLNTTYVDPIKADGTLNAQVLDTTLITNDGLKINVNLTTTDANGTREQAALAQTSIAIVEFDASGQLTGNVFNYTTSGEGIIPAEFIGRMQRNKSYRVLVNDPVNGYPYSQSQDFTITDLENAPIDNRGVRTFVLVLDPAGYVYDALTGARVAGADVTFYHSSGTQVAGPFAVFTQVPSTTQTNPQLSGASGIAGGFEFIGSNAGSDITPGFYYITVSFNTNPALGNTYLPVTLSGASWAGIQEPYAGQLFRVDLQNQPIGMRVPLFRPGQQSSLNVAKSANRDTAAVGDIVTFAVTVANASTAQTDPNNPVVIRDTLPQGMAYLAGSAVLAGGTPVAATEQGGGVLDFPVGQLQAAGANGDSATVYYQAVVDTSSRPGMTLRNIAVAMINLVTLSNTAEATVQVIEDPLFDQATLIGRVYFDMNRNGRHDKHEPGVAHAGLILDDGTYVVTDENGLYSVPGARPGLPSTGRRTIKLDVNTIPEKALVTTPVSQFVILKPGSMDKANFGVYAGSGVFVNEPVCASDYLVSGGGACRADRIELLSAMFDAAIGTVDSGAGAARPDEDMFPEGLYSRGRAAVFYHLFQKRKFDLVLAYDSEKRHTLDMETYRDKDLYYPSYGDSSTVHYLTETQGKIYAQATTQRARFIAGNYRVSLDDTELASLYSNLSGVKLDLTNRSDLPGLPDDDYSEMTLFTSRRKQLHGVTELRSTGGAQYYLANSKIVSGSERITVEIRDELIPEKVLQSLILLRDTDYAIDYLTGNVRLFKPVSRYAESSQIYRPGVGGGDPVWIVAEYAYEPSDNDYGTLGARFYHKSRFGFGVGATVAQENFEGRDHSLNAVDLHLFSGSAEVFTLEMGRSRAQGATRYMSHDAGRSFTQTDARNTGSGQGLKLALNVGAGRKLQWNSYLYDIDAGFSGGAFRQKGIRRYGTILDYGDDDAGLRFDFTQAKALPGADSGKIVSAGGQANRVMSVKYREKTKSSSFEAEIMHKYAQAGASAVASWGLDNGTTNSLAVRYEKTITDRITLNVFQQVTLRATHNQQAGVGVAYKMNDKVSFTAQAVLGTYGGGGRLGFERSTGGGSTAYVTMETGYSETRGARAVTSSAGVSQEVSDGTSAYMQFDSTQLAGESIRSRVIGINHDIRTADNMAVSLSAERSEDHSSVQGRYFTNVFNVSGHVNSPGGTRLAADAGFRVQQGGVSKEFFEYNVAYERKLIHNLTTFAEYSYDAGIDKIRDVAESKYTKSLLGLAWRPQGSDRVNVIARAGRVREYRTLAMNDALNPDTVAGVFSLEGLYDVSHDLMIREKVAARLIRQTMSPLPPARTRTTLWINGLTWRPTSLWDLTAEYRTTHQPLQRNFRNGLSFEFGYTMRDTVRFGFGYNFSSYSDNAFHLLDQSFKGAFFELSGKM